VQAQESSFRKNVLAAVIYFFAMVVFADMARGRYVDHKSWGPAALAATLFAVAALLTFIQSRHSR
jgi:hypothetical protein